VPVFNPVGQYQFFLSPSSAGKNCRSVVSQSTIGKYKADQKNLAKGHYKAGIILKRVNLFLLGHSYIRTLSILSMLVYQKEIK